MRYSKGSAKINNTLSNISAFATRIIGTAQPFSMGGDSVIWKKTPVNITPNPYALIQLVSMVIQKKFLY